VWLGCPACHRTWSVEANTLGNVTDDATVAADPALATLSAVRGTLVAALAVALAFILRLLLRPALGDASPFLLFTPAVALSAFYGGLFPGLLATGLGTALGSHFFLNAPGAPVVEQWDRIVLFILVGAVIAGSTTLLRRSRQQLAASLWREQKARAMAEAADRTKDDFLALVSHELKTPMSVVLGWIAAIRERRLSPEAESHALEAVERNARVLSRLVDDVLDRSRMATGTLRLDCQEISLVTVVRAAVDQVRGRIDAGRQHLDVALPQEDAIVLGDSIRLQQVVTNLLTNAAKFTPKGGHISVAMAIGADRVRLTVADTGAGIAADLLPHLFEPFRQGRATIDRSRQGLGLGLSIARYLIEQHDGTIEAASAGPGRGAAFTIVLPLVTSGRPQLDDARAARTRALRPPTASIH
jgi:signal transduction histidine kinase